MCTEFTSKTTSLQVLFDVLLRKRLHHHTSKLSKLQIDSLHGFFPTHLLEGLGRQVFAVFDRGTSVLDLVLVFLALVELTATDKLGYDLLDLLDLTRCFVDNLDLVRLLLECKFFLGKLHSNLDKRFLILTTVGKAPTNVLIGRLVKVSLNVVERMLCDVSDTGIRVLPDRTSLRLDFSDKELDHGTLTGTVLANTGNTRAQRHLDTDVVESRLCVPGVRESTVAHLHEGLTLRLDTLDGARLGELELHLRSTQREVRTSGGVDLDIFVKISLVCAELQVVESQDVGTAVVQEAGVVTHNDGCNVLERVQVCLDPSNVDDVKVVRWFVKKQDIGLLKHSTSKGKLHTPSTTERRHSVVGLGLTVFGETDCAQNFTDLLHGDFHSLDLRVDGDVIDTGQVRLFTLDIGFDENSPDLADIRETLDLVVGDRSHECGLTTIIRTEKTVVTTTEKLHLRVVKKDLGTVRKSEVTVAQFFGVIFLIVLVRNLHHLLGLNTDSLDLAFGGGEIEAQKWRHVLRPLQVLHKFEVHEGGSDVARKLDNGKLGAFGVLGTELFLDCILQLGNISTDRSLLVGKSLQTLQLSDTTFGDGTGFRVGDGLCVRLQGWKKQGQEGCSIDRVVNQLGHVVDNDSCLTLGGSVLFAQSTEQQGDNHSQSRRLDGLDECYTSHLVHDFGDFLRLGNSGEDLARHVLDITVSNDIKRSLHGCGSGDLNLLLGVPHARCDLGNNLWEGICELPGGCFGEACDTQKRKLTNLPLLLDRQCSENGRKERFDRERVDFFADSECSVLCCSLNILTLGDGLFQAGSKTVLDEWLGLG
mmetsp:Transcript_1828/g.4233  ORF Transcript_1828/g.4233 Transcript_1828/m.4233 type:complete len:815 (+) Transcript_1828:652-3096(+)